MLETVKLALRIKHTKLDSEITRLIKAARAELIRSGANEVIVNDDKNSLVAQAVITYCQWHLTEHEGLMAKYEAAFSTLEDAIRKSTNVQ